MQRSPIQEEYKKGDDGTHQVAHVEHVANSETPTLSHPSPPAKSLRKFHNGWNRQLENLVAEWADKASCYQWMHQKTEVRFQKFNYYFTIPVIIMSTLTGTANFATNSIVSTEEQAKFITFGIGAISLIAGIISTVANFLRYAQGSEAHRVAAISWGKFQRFISIELSLHPNERMDAMSFLKMGRIELDRLIEQSPPIPTRMVEEFHIAFRDKKDIRRPEIAGGIEHTRIFEDRDSRLAKVAAEAAFAIQQKKGLMRQLVMEDIDKRIVSRTLGERLALEEDLRQEIMSTAREMAQSVARETTLTTLRSTPNATAFKNSNASTGLHPREEIHEVIPHGVVKQIQQRMGRQLSIIGGSANKPPMTIAEAAAAIGAIRTGIESPPQQIKSPQSPPSSVKLRIHDPEVEAIEAQTRGIFGNDDTTHNATNNEPKK